jgi:hypothetical protein
MRQWVPCCKCHSLAQPVRRKPGSKGYRIPIYPNRYFFFFFFFFFFFGFLTGARLIFVVAAILVIVYVLCIMLNNH